MEKADPNKIPGLRDLYPHLSEEELKEVEKTFFEYTAQTIEQYERISSDPKAYAGFKRLVAEEKRKRKKKNK